MADFRTHITTSCVLGVGYGAAGYYYFEQTPTTSALAAGLCGLAGMLPDLDSDSGVPVREPMALAAAVVSSSSVTPYIWAAITPKHKARK